MVVWTRLVVIKSGKIRYGYILDIFRSRVQSHQDLETDSMRAVRERDELEQQEDGED